MFKEVYITESTLDDIFSDRYGDIRTGEVFKKNCIELLVELGEFINETKCFKYWSIKKPNKEQVLDELADVLKMLMTFLHVINKEINEYELNDIDCNLMTLINNTYVMATDIMNNISEELIDSMFKNVLGIAYKLELSKKEIIDAIIKKQQIVFDRLNSEY